MLTLWSFAPAGSNYEKNWRSKISLNGQKSPVNTYLTIYGYNKDFSAPVNVLFLDQLHFLHFGKQNIRVCQFSLKIIIRWLEYFFASLTKDF